MALTINYYEGRNKLNLKKKIIFNFKLRSFFTQKNTFYLKLITMSIKIRKIIIFIVFLDFFGFFKFQISVLSIASKHLIVFKANKLFLIQFHIC